MQFMQMESMSKQTFRTTLELSTHFKIWFVLHTQAQKDEDKGTTCPFCVAHFSLKIFFFFIMGLFEKVVSRKSEL